MKSALDRVMARIERIPFSGCWIFMGATNEAGYGVVGRGGRGAGNDRAHRVTYRAFKGETPNGMYVCHRCDVPSCCNPDHLFLGTPVDNRLDCKEKRRDVKPPRNPHLRGERHYAARFTNEQVQSIREAMRRGGVTQQAMADAYGVSRDCIGKIARGERWT